MHQTIVAIVSYLNKQNIDIVVDTLSFLFYLNSELMRDNERKPIFNGGKNNAVNCTILVHRQYFWIIWQSMPKPIHFSYLNVQTFHFCLTPFQICVNRNGNVKINIKLNLLTIFVSGNYWKSTSGAVMALHKKITNICALFLFELQEKSAIGYLLGVWCKQTKSKCFLLHQ